MTLRRHFLFFFLHELFSFGISNKEMIINRKMEQTIEHRQKTILISQEHT